MRDEYDNQEPRIDPREFVAMVTSADNLAAMMDDAQLTEIAAQVIADYDLDDNSMSDWRSKMDKAIELATLVKEDKTYPFEGAANVKYPLITSAALQFNARAYPAIVAPDRVVRTKVWGTDRAGKKAARGDRVSEFMSWQLKAQILEWEEDTDKLLVQLPIVGTMVRKWWYDPVEQRARCRTLTPGAFVVNDNVKSLSDAPRCAEKMSLYPLEVEQRKRSGAFVEDFELPASGSDDEEPQEFIEQHTRLDLDEDGYPEPYVVTVHCDTRKVVRIVADFEPDDVRFKTEMQAVHVPVQTVTQARDELTGAIYDVPTQTMRLEQQEVATGIIAIKRGTYFEAHHFLPGIDGGFWGTGLGILLGDISASINTILNMMLDASHYASLGGGFIGSDMRLKGGAQRMRPGEWKKVEAPGGEVRKAVVPMQFSGPDATMFQLLGMLIDVGREIASVQDVMTGDANRQNQTATATLALIEQGMMVFKASYKRIYRSFGREYQMLAKINAGTVPPQVYNTFHDDEDEQGQPVQHDPAQEFAAADMDIQPVADPSAVTKMQQAAKAQFIMQMAEMGLVDKAEATARVAEAMDLEDVDALIPQPDPAQQQMMEMQGQLAQAELSEKQAKIELTLAQVEEARSAAVENMANAESDMVRASNEKMKIRLDALLKVLEDDRQRLAETVRANGRMEGAPGNGAAGTLAQGATRTPAGGPGLTLVGGAGNPGGGQTVPDPLGGMGG